MSSETTHTVGVYDLLAWLETNKQRVIIAFVAVVVIGFGVAIYRYKADQTELAASDALLEIKTPVSANETAAPPDPAAYLKVAQQYPGTAAADRALLLAASALFAEGKYSEAEAQFSKYLSAKPESPFAPTAAYGVASCQEAEGKLDQALASYQNLPVRYPNSSVLDDAKLGAARIYDAKHQPEAALRVYDELARASSMGGMSSVASEAMTRREDLLAKNPNLAKTNTTSSATSGTTITGKTNSAAAAGTNAVKPR